MNRQTAISGALMGVLFVAIYLINFLFAWPITRWSGISNGGFLFGDFSWLSKWSTDCRLDLSLPNLFTAYSQIENSETCPGFNYGMALIILLSVFQISWDSYILIALIVGVLGVFGLGVFLGRTYSMNSWQRVLSVLAIFSPGAFLLFERGNLDLIIFLMVVLAAVLSNRNLFIPSLLIIVLASLMKFYTAPLVLLMALLAKRPAQRVVAWAMTIGTFVWVAIDLSRGPTLPIQGSVQFGYPVLNHYFEWLGLFLEPVPSALGFIFPWLVWALLVLRQRSLDGSSLARLEANTRVLSGDYVFLFSGITFSAMFFVGLSYDYRLVFLALAGMGLLLKGKFSRRTSIFLWSSLLVAVWGSGALGNSLTFIPPTIEPFLIGGFQLAGDLSTFLWVGVLLYFCALVAATKIGWFSKLLSFITFSRKTT